MIPYLAIMVWYGTMIPYLAIMVWYGTMIPYLAIMGWYGVSTDPYPIPHTPRLTHPTQGRFQKISGRRTSPPPHHSSELWESRWERVDQVGCVDLGVWGMGYRPIRTPYPIPHTPRLTHPIQGRFQKISDQKNSSVHAFRKEFWESRWESSDQVGCVDLGVWGMGYDRHRPHPTSRRLAEGRRHSHRRRTRRRSTGHDSGNTTSLR